MPCLKLFALRLCRHVAANIFVMAFPHLVKAPLSFVFVCFFLSGMAALGA